jgi:plastocyanin
MTRRREERKVRKTAIALAAAAAAAALVVSGCGGSDSKTTPTKTQAPRTNTTGGTAAPAAAQATVKVDIKNFKFAPPNVTVEKGGKITWTNSDSADHTATADDKAFDTGTLHGGDSKAATFDKAGTYSYTCLFHPFMKGRVVVQ